MQQSAAILVIVSLYLLLSLQSLEGSSELPSDQPWSAELCCHAEATGSSQQQVSLRFSRLGKLLQETDEVLCVTVMFKNMGRQAFGKLQAKLFPKYFLLSVLTLALQLGTLKFALPIGLQREQLTSLGRSFVPQVYIAILDIVICLAAMLCNARRLSILLLMDNCVLNADVMIQGSCIHTSFQFAVSNLMVKFTVLYGCL